MLKVTSESVPEGQEEREARERDEERSRGRRVEQQQNL